jgi:signal transduction histidine kinase/CRP-like cAMP-binding protein
MPITRSIQDIKNNKLFSGVNESVLTSFFDQKEIKEAREGALIYKTGNESNAIFLIIRGEVRIKFSANNYFINRMFNDFFGEKEFVEETKRISSALAFSNLTYYRIDKNVFNKLIAKYPTINENLRKYGEIKLHDLPSDIETKLKIFERDKPISFKIFPKGKNLEEEKQKKKETPSVMTQQILPDLDSIDESFEEENVTMEQELELERELEGLKNESEVPEKSEEPKEITEEITNDSETLIENTDYTTPPPTESITEIPDEIKQGKNNGELINPEVEINNELSEPGINREVIRKIFFSLNRIFDGISISDLVNNSKKALKDLTNSENADLILVDEKTSSMQKIIIKGGKSKVEYFQLTEGLTGACAVEKRTLKYDRPTEDNRFNSKIDQPGPARMKRILYFPVINDSGETVAVVQTARENKKYTEDEVSYLAMLSKQMDTAISRTKKLEEFIKEEKLNAGKKLGEIVAKEINVPINIIESYTKILSQKKLPSDTDDIIRMLYKQAASVEEITDTIFKVLVNEIILENNKIHFNEFVDDVLELLSEYCETRDTKLFKKIGDGAVVDIDRAKLYTAIFQLIKFCVDDSKRDGKIYFSTELTGEMISITIQNEGGGNLAFAEGDVLDYFYNKSKIKEEETGLLLAKKIISAHSGEVQLESIKGVGSTFRITIPVART